MSTTDQFLTFRLDDRRYGLPLKQVARAIRVVDITPLPQAPAVVLGVIDLHGELVPVLNIRLRLGLPQKTTALCDQFIIATALHQTVALLVDEVLGLIGHSLTSAVGMTPFSNAGAPIEGVIQLPDGLILIHDLDRFLTHGEADALHKALTEHATT